MYLSCYNLELNDYIKVLDQRLEDKQKKELCDIVFLKKRNTGAPSTQPKPSNSPTWAVSGKAIHYYSIFVTVIVCAGDSSLLTEPLADLTNFILSADDAVAD